MGLFRTDQAQVTSAYNQLIDLYVQSCSIAAAIESVASASGITDNFNGIIESALTEATISPHLTAGPSDYVPAPLSLESAIRELRFVAIVTSTTIPLTTITSSSTSDTITSLPTATTRSSSSSDLHLVAKASIEVAVIALAAIIIILLIAWFLISKMRTRCSPSSSASLPSRPFQHSESPSNRQELDQSASHQTYELPTLDNVHEMEMGSLEH